MGLATLARWGGEMRAQRMRGIRLAVHAALLLLPPAVFASLSGRGIACAAILMILSIVEGLPDPYVERRGLALTSALSLLLIAWLSIAAGRGLWIGALIAMSGVLLRAAAIRALGPGFTSAIEPGPRYVTTGIYAKVRHPSEVGLLLIGGGLALLGGSFVAAALALLVLMPSSLVRIHLEERALSARFATRGFSELRKAAMDTWRDAP